MFNSLSPLSFLIIVFSLSLNATHAMEDRKKDNHSHCCRKDLYYKHSLNLKKYEELDLACIKAQTQITRLTLEEHSEEKRMLTDEDLLVFTHLEKLDLSSNRIIKGSTLSCLTNLRTLTVWSNNVITDEYLRQCTQLTHLHLFGTRRITDASITQLKNLTDLSLCRTFSSITLKGLYQLPKLMNLRNDLGIECTEYREWVTHKDWERLWHSVRLLMATYARTE